MKPLILLPASAVAGWSPDQLQMILLHELAHVRRWDNLVNLLQRIVEAALFYQPAVWLVSNWVRLEREHCCDAVVLAQGNEPQDYAETLASLAMPGISPRYAAAALASHQLVSRIRHILNVEDRSMKISRRALLSLICGAVLCSSLVAVYAQQQTDEPPQSPSEEPKQLQAAAAEDQGANGISDADRELTLLKTHRNRILAAQRQVEILAKSYSEGTITPDFYLDALYRQANATESYVRSFSALLSRFERYSKIDPEYQQLLKSLVVLEAAPDSGKQSDSNPATPQVPKERDQARTPAETDTGDGEPKTPSSDGRKEHSVLTKSLNRIVASQRQREAAEVAWREDQVPSENYLNALRGEVDSFKNLVKTSEDLLAEFTNGGRIDPVVLKELATFESGATEVTIRNLLAQARENWAIKTRELEKASGSGETGANSATAQVADERKPTRIPADTNAAADQRAQRDQALADWRARRAELERLQSDAGALHKKMADLGDNETPDLHAAYVAARKAVQEGSANEAIARERFYEIIAKIDRTAYKPGWSAAQLTGPPNAQPGREDRLAWSSATPDGQSEWIEVTYDQPVDAVAVMISESFNPGAIGSVKVFDATGKWQWVLEGQTARPIDKDHQVTMLPLSTERPVAKVRITIESVPVPGYNQIDAVGLLDKKGQMLWATSAAASSERSQAKSAGDPTYDESVEKAIEFLTRGAHPHVHLQDMNCQNCHQIQAGTGPVGSHLRALSRWSDRRQAVDRPATSSDAATVAQDDAREKQELQRQQRLAPLHKEINELNTEIQKIQEELELQSQRDKSRIELERLRKKLEESHQAREAPQPQQR